MDSYMFTLIPHIKNKKSPSTQKDPAVLFYKTPAGLLKVFYTTHGITKTEFVDESHIQVDAAMLLPKNLILEGTIFQIQVWQAAFAIPTGKTVTYQELAQSIGKPKAFRAVARALATNKIAYFIPCHRVIKKNGELCGFFWGVERKAALLRAEKI